MGADNNETRGENETLSLRHAKRGGFQVELN